MHPTLLHQLEAWLDDRVYEAGVLLYQQIFGPGFLLSMLKTGPDAYNRQKLVEALESHYQLLAQQQQDLLASYPDALTGELERAKSLMDQRTVLKERMRLLYDQGISKGDQLRGYAFDILALGDTLSGIYGRKEFFEQHGYLPDAPGQDATLSETELIKRLLTVRTFVSKYRKRVDQTAPASPDHQKYSAKLTEYTTEAHHLQRQIDALTNDEYDHAVFD